MEYVIAWAGFLGAWALVAGPLRQAALELREVQIDREGYANALSEVERRPVSPWWWLLPPVAYVKIRNESRREHEQVMHALPLPQRREIYGFQNAANAWLLVAGGASLIAVKETWELVEQYEWPIWVFCVGLAAMAILCVSTTVTRMLRTQKEVDPDGYAARRARPRPQRGRPRRPTES